MPEPRSDSQNSLRPDATTLARITIDALERTAFVLADPADDPQALPPISTTASIDYSGPCNGGIDLVASAGFGRNLAASLLGCEPSEVSDSTAAEAVRELANIVGGSMILELGGTDCCYSLGLPRTSASPRNDFVVSCVLNAEGERLEVHVIAA